MKITRIHIDGFGRFHDWELAGLSNGLTVIYGKNEAGKSTLLDFVSFTLFGYPRLKERRRPPLSGGRHGGRLWLQDAQGREMLVERGGEGDFRFALGGEQSDSESQLKQVLGGASAELYQTIYGIDLDQLDEVEKLNRAGMEDRIFSLGIGLAGADLGQFENSLAERSKAFFIPRGRVQRLVTTASEIAKLESQLRGKRDGVERYDSLQDELAKLEGGHRAVSEELEQLSRRQGRAQQRLKAYPEVVKWLGLSVRLGELEAEAVGLLNVIQEGQDGAAGGIDWPTEADERSHDRLVGRIEEREKDLRAATAKVAELATERDNAQAPGRYAGAEGLLDYLKTRLGSFEAAENQLNACEAEQGRLENQQAESAKRFSVDLDLATIREFRGEFELRKLARQQLQGLADLQDQQRRDKERAEQIRQNLVEVAKQVDHYRQSLQQLGCSEGAEEAWFASGRARLSELEIELELAMKRLDTSLSKPRVIGRGWLFGLSLVMLLVGMGVLGLLLWLLREHESVFKEIKWVEAVLIGLGGVNCVFGVLGLIALGVWLRIQKRVDSSVTIKETRDWQVIRRDCDELKNTIERAKRCVDELATLDAKSTAMGTALQNLEQAQREAATEQAELMQGWSEQLQQWGLSEFETILQPATVDDFLAQVKELLTNEQALSRVRSQRQKAHEEVEVFRASVRQQAPDFVGTNASEYRRLVEQIERDLAKQSNILRLSQALEVEERRLQQLQQEHEALSRERQEFYQNFRVGDEAGFQELVARGAEKQRLLKEIEASEGLVRSLCGFDHFDSTVAELRAIEPGELQDQENDCKIQISALKQQQSEISQRRGELTNELRYLQQPDEQFRVESELACLRTRYQEELKEWLTLQLGMSVLGQVKQAFERDKQPAVIQHARRHFAQITENRYTDLRVSLSRRHVEVFDQAGRAKLVEQLSRGTREQLLLSLRFGLIEQYEGHSEPLPMVLDDIMVNFDSQRSENFISSLSSFAQGRQVLMFTCHRRIAEQCSQIGAELREL